MHHPIFSAAFSPGTPSVDEEYFEWTDMLEAVARCRGSFLFVELGAGYGRWSARALEAAEKRGIAAHAILVEAEPSRTDAMHKHMKARNGCSGTYEVIQAAVGATEGEQLFLVAGPREITTDNWYGQVLARSVAMDEGSFAPGDTTRSYFGRPLVFNPYGWGAIPVPVVTVDQILPKTGVVDIIDMDIQGAEADVIAANRDLLRNRVACLHIGTHSQDVESRMRQALSEDGWIKVWDFPCQSKTPTPYGVVDFIDGVQTWHNPRYVA